MTTWVYTVASHALDNVANSYTGAAVDQITNGGLYIDDSDVQSLVSIRFSGMNIATLVTLTSATLLLTRDPSDYGSTGANGALGVRGEATAAAAVFVDSNTTTNPYNRTYNSTQVDVTFDTGTGTKSIDVTTILQALITAYGAANITAVNLSIGGMDMGWVGSAVSWRAITGDETSALPTLTIVGSESAAAVLTATSARCLNYVG